MDPTDEAFWRALEDPRGGALRQRRPVPRDEINRFYSVCLDLVLVDLDGRAVAAARGAEFPAVSGHDYRTAPWFKEALPRQWRQTTWSTTSPQTHKTAR